MRTLQLGLEWFPERAGGLPRYYYELFKASPPHFEMRGMVLGSERVAADTQGRLRSFAAADAPLPRRLLGARRRYWELTGESAPDLVVSHFALFTLPVLDLIERPLVVHFHGPWAAEGAVEGTAPLREALKRRIEARVYRRARLFIVLSDAFADVLHRVYRVPHEDIRVVPGGVDLGRFDIADTRLEARARLGWPGDRPILLAVRRLVRRMGLDVLVEAMVEVVRRHPSALLMIAGRGPLAPDLSALIEARGLKDNVRLIGFLPDEALPLAYRAADLSVVPSQALEGFGLVALESLAAGTPAMVTPVGGLPEVVAPLSPELVFESAGAGAIAACLNRALDGGRLPDAAACRNHAAAFDWPIIARRVAAVYAEALAP